MSTTFTAGDYPAGRCRRPRACNARKAQRAFASQWSDIAKVPITEALVSRAEALAWDFALGGHDAVQLASALTWQEAVDAEITLGTFDRQLWDAGTKGVFESGPRH